MRLAPVLLLLLLAFATLLVAPGTPRAAPDAPTVVSLAPANGAADVDPALGEIRITFSEPMRDGSWSVCGGGPEFPKLLGIAYEPAGTTLVMRVRLRPEHTYRFWLNSRDNRNFVSRRGVPLEPVAVTFRTGPGDGKEIELRPLSPKPLTFALEDVNGVEIRTEDYAGVPIFLVFGACW